MESTYSWRNVLIKIKARVEQFPPVIIVGQVYSSYKTMLILAEVRKYIIMHSTIELNFNLGKVMELPKFSVINTLVILMLFI